MWRLDIVVHACNPSHAGSRGRKIGVPSWPGARVRPYFKTKEKRVGSVAQVVKYLSSMWP
jgi:hypothetical protein